MNSAGIFYEEWAEAKASHMRSASQKAYFDKARDEKVKEAYYEQISFEDKQIIQRLHTLLVHTHTKQLPYAPHRYIYPWVDLQENGQLKSIYSGNRMDPLLVIQQDIQILAKLEEGELSEEAQEVKFNCEHVVPQSWFGKQEPMRGDLHHLFTCEPGCNSRRGNSPYYDFPAYSPELTVSGISHGCGMIQEGKFEPEYGKGIVARATLYFYIRYLGNVIIQDKANLDLLLDWHRKYPITIYEQHRNAAIFELQGNRNPFIDYPEQFLALV